MRYLGGKDKISKWIQSNILKVMGSSEIYIEPFLGGGSTFVKNAPLFKSAIASDIHKDLILMWQAVSMGWVPPLNVSYDDYMQLKEQKSSPLRGFAGYAASFGGKWFGGYCNDNKYNRDYVFESRKSVLYAQAIFSSATILNIDYKLHDVNKKTLLYCDPPYDNTTGYENDIFSSKEFWNIAEKWVTNFGATVIVSEESAPSNWFPLSMKTRKAAIRKKYNNVRNEVLWIHKYSKI